MLWKKTRRGELSAAEAAEILRAFQRIGVEIHSSADLVAGAFELATALDRSVYDSLYLALAIAQRSVFVTADRKLYSIVKSSPLSRSIRWLEDEL